MQMHKILKVIISGGGTGGHIFPAIAIANALKKINEKIDILFIGAKDRMEMQKVPQAGYKIKGLWISGFQRKFTLKNLLFPLKVISSLISARKIIKKFKPDIVIGVGGYSSGPVLYVASKKHIPTLIQEQNSYAGITNKILGPLVDKICVAYENMERFFPKEKIVFTGNPVRQDILHLDGKKDDAFNYFNLSTNKKTLLVIGGSLGALTINETIYANLKSIEENDFQLIWQTGKSYYQTAVANIPVGLKGNVSVFDFISKMDYAYAAADVIISRAGAIAISELCNIKKPIILIPSPNVAEDHQTKNAMSLVTKDAAIMITDQEAGDKLITEAINLLHDEKKQQKLKENINQFAINDADQRIAREALSLIN